MNEPIAVEFSTEAGYGLLGNCWHPKSARAAVVVHCATAVRQGFYSRFAAWLADRGIGVLTYDYRGIGQSRQGDLRGLEACWSTWATQDVPAATAWARQQWPGVPLVAVGHSFGGLAPGLSLGGQDLDALITVAAQTAYWADWPMPQRLRLYALWHGVLPLLTRVVGYWPGGKLGMMEDLPRAAIAEWHARWRFPDLRDQFGAAAVPVYFDRYAGPILATGAIDDAIGSSAALARLHRMFTNAQIESLWLDPGIHGQPIGHFGFFRAEVGRWLWPQWLRWIEAQLGC